MGDVFPVHFFFFIRKPCRTWYFFTQLNSKPRISDRIWYEIILDVASILARVRKKDVKVKARLPFLAGKMFYLGSNKCFSAQSYTLHKYLATLQKIRKIAIAKIHAIHFTFEYQSVSHCSICMFQRGDVLILSRICGVSTLRTYCSQKWNPFFFEVHFAARCLADFYGVHKCKM